MSSLQQPVPLVVQLVVDPPAGGFSRTSPPAEASKDVSNGSFLVLAVESPWIAFLLVESLTVVVL